MSSTAFGMKTLILDRTHINFSKRSGKCKTSLLIAQIKMQSSVLFFFSFILFPLLCGVDILWHTPPCSTVVHIISRQSPLFDVILNFVQPSSLRSSSLPSPLYFHYHRPPSYVVFISSHHMSIPLQPSFLYFLCLSTKGEEMVENENVFFCFLKKLLTQFVQ